MSICPHVIIAGLSLRIGQASIAYKHGDHKHAAELIDNAGELLIEYEEAEKETHRESIPAGEYQIINP